MIPEIVFGFPLKKGEQIEYQTKQSFFSLLISWLAIPAVFFMYFLIFILPGIIKRAITNTVVEVVEDSINVGDITDNISSEVSGSLGGFLGTLRSVLHAIGIFVIVVLVFAWLCVCLYQTYKYLTQKCYITLTNYRVIGKVGDNVYEMQLDKLKNVYIERHIWGRVFKYGSVVIQADRRAITFKHIHDPAQIKDLLLPYTEGMN